MSVGGKGSHGAVCLSGVTPIQPQYPYEYMSKTHKDTKTKKIGPNNNFYGVSQKMVLWNVVRMLHAKFH